MSFVNNLASDGLSNDKTTMNLFKPISSLGLGYIETCGAIKCPLK